MLQLISFCRHLASSLTREYAPQAEKSALGITGYLETRLSEARSEDVVVFLGRLCVGLIRSPQFIVDITREQNSKGEPILSLRFDPAANSISIAFRSSRITLGHF